MQTQDEIILYPSKLKNIVLILMACAFVAVGVWIVLNGGVWFGCFLIVFFGLGGLAALAHIGSRKSYLRIHKDGFEMSTIRRAYTMLWKDIAELGMAKQTHPYGVTTKMVGFNYVPEYEPRKTLHAVNKSLCGFEGALSDSYGLSKTELLELLQQHLQHWRATNKPEPGVATPNA